MSSDSIDYFTGKYEISTLTKICLFNCASLSTLRKYTFSLLFMHFSYIGYFLYLEIYLKL